MALNMLRLLAVIFLVTMSVVPPTAFGQDMADASDDSTTAPAAPISAPLAQSGDEDTDQPLASVEDEWQMARVMGWPCQQPYVQVNCPELNYTPSPEAPRAEDIPVLLKDTGACPDVKSAQAMAGILVKRVGTGVAGEACAFAHRAFPGSQPITCFQGAICTADVAGVGVRVYLGNGQRLNARAIKIRVIAAYGPNDAVRSPCVLVAKEKAFASGENPNFGVQIPPDAGYTCNGPLPNVSTADAGTPGVIGVPTGPGCPDTASAQKAIGVSVERESYVEACVFFWRPVPGHGKITCPSGWLCTIHLVETGDPLKDKVYLVVGDGKQYDVFGVTVRYKSAYPAGDAVYDNPPCWLVQKETAFLQSPSGGVPNGQVRPMGFSCDGSSVQPSSSVAPASASSSSSMGCASELLSKPGWTDRGSGFWKYRGERISFTVPQCAKKVDGDKGSYGPGQEVPPGIEFSLYL